MRLITATIRVTTPMPSELSDQVLNHIADQTVKALESQETGIKRAIAQQLDNYAKFVEIDITYL